MDKHAVLSATHSPAACNQAAAYASASMLSFALAGLLLLGGCNKGPAPAAARRERPVCSSSSPRPSCGARSRSSAAPGLRSRHPLLRLLLTAAPLLPRRRPRRSNIPCPRALPWWFAWDRPSAPRTTMSAIAFTGAPGSVRSGSWREGPPPQVPRSPVQWLPPKGQGQVQGQVETWA